MNKKQRLLFALVITFLVLVNMGLAVVLMSLPPNREYRWIFIPTAFLMAVGIYFLSFKIWDKEKKEAPELEEVGGFMNKKQRLLFALVTAFLVPVNFFVAIVLDLLTGELLGYGMLIPTAFLMAVVIYFLSFKIWDKKKQEARKDQESKDL